MSSPAVVFLDDAPPRRDLLGGKGYGLVRLSVAGLRVPPGFVVTTAAYRAAIPDALRRQIRYRLEGVAPDAPVGDVDRVTAEIRAGIVDATAQHDGRGAVDEAYARLSERCGTEAAVAVRSSSAAEDAADRSFAGEHDTFLWVRGAEDVQRRVRDCWASLFTTRAVHYARGLAGGAVEPAMAVVVQQMVPARSAGVFLTLNPLNGDRSKVVIESVWGLGEPLVSGQVDPDRFLVDKVTGEILRRDVVVKPTRLVTDPGSGRGTAVAAVTDADQQQPSLSDPEIGELVRLARLVERDAGRPQDGEFATEDGAAPGNVFLVQARPETAWSHRAPQPVAAGKTAMDAILGTLSGFGRGGSDPLQRGG
ncbi:MAG: phosphoenolpyruvate synthase [Pseudonocardiaceae bacterium]|nr:phosphoenolpyruvate synthase [Pseudonocardiaceae bacterium]